MKIYSANEAHELLHIDVDVHESLFESVIDHVQINVFENREFIVRAADPLNRLFFLIEGKAKIAVSHEDGATSIVYFVKPNELIGELTLIGIEKQPKDVIAIGRCICLSVPMETAERQLLNDQRFMLEMSRYIGTKLIDRTWFNAKQQHYELKHRLAAHILQCESDGIYDEKHAQTAEYLAVSYRHLLHTMRHFREEGLVTKTDGGYAFDRGALEDLARVLD